MLMHRMRLKRSVERLLLRPMPARARMLVLGELLPSLGAKSKPVGSQHSGAAAQRSSRTKRLPALLLPRVAPDPLRENFERSVGLGIRTWPDAANLAHLAGERPEQRSPPRNRPRGREIPRSALSRLDARGWFGVGAKRARGGRKGVYQAWSIASGYAYGDRTTGARPSPQGMVPGCHKWPSAPPGLAPGTGLRVRSGRRRLPRVSHRPCSLSYSSSSRIGGLT